MIQDDNAHVSTRLHGYGGRARVNPVCYYVSRAELCVCVCVCASSACPVLFRLFMSFYVVAERGAQVKVCVKVEAVDEGCEGGAAGRPCSSGAPRAASSEPSLFFWRAEPRARCRVVSSVSSCESRREVLYLVDDILLYLLESTIGLGLGLLTRVV
jgi:hypothetical protein